MFSVARGQRGYTKTMREALLAAKATAPDEAGAGIEELLAWPSKDLENKARAFKESVWRILWPETAIPTTEAIRTIGWEQAAARMMTEPPSEPVAAAILNPPLPVAAAILTQSLPAAASTATFPLPVAAAILNRRLRTKTSVAVRPGVPADASRPRPDIANELDDDVDLGTVVVEQAGELIEVNSPPPGHKEASHKHQSSLNFPDVWKR